MDTGDVVRLAFDLTYSRPSITQRGIGGLASRRWTDAELAFLRANLGLMTMEEIGEVLGRTAEAVKIVQVRYGIPAPSRRPGILTGNQISELLHVDIHAVSAWARRGILSSCQRMAGERGILLIERWRLIRWAVNPMNWVYYRPERVTDAVLARLLALRAARWGDAWWTSGDVAAYHGVSTKQVLRWVRAGRLSAVRWGNWYVLRSAAIAVLPKVEITPEAVRFIRSSLAEGCTYAQIARKMKRSVAWVKRHAQVDSSTDNWDYQRDENQ